LNQKEENLLQNLLPENMRRRLLLVSSWLRIILH
jgi:hypothetical protein